VSDKIILYATDYSAASEKALKVAEALAQDLKARLLIVHVSQEELAPVGELFDEEPASEASELTRLRSVVPKDSQIAYEHRLIYGEAGSERITQPAEELLRVAEEVNAEMIVLGTHGRSAVSRALMGSVAETIIRRATCPVVTVKGPRREPPPT
jgi:nucleotide-binding universal stress UspA family protein